MGVDISHIINGHGFKLGNILGTILKKTKRTPFWLPIAHAYNVGPRNLSHKPLSKH